MSKGKLYVATQVLKQIVQKTVLIASLSCSALAVAAPAVVTPADWLVRMVKASSSTTFEGVMVYENSGGLSAVRVFHTIRDGLVSERMIYQNGPYQEIIRQGDQVAIIRGDGDVNRYRTDGVVGLVDRLGGYRDDLRKSYILMYGGNDRVAGRDALRIDVKPRDSHRYGYSLWLDQASGLLLRSELIGEGGAVLERLQYVDIALPSAMPDKLLEPSRPVVWQARPKRQTNVPKLAELTHLSWESGWIPSGFELVGVSQINSPVSDQKVDSLLFSDGLASFSLFVEEDQSKILGPASEQIGATTAVSRLFRQDDAYYNVTVIGEISSGVAERIVVSVRPRGETQEQ